tara:strand:- start:3864 stop:5132 length:1269 start_codon:yes stop_codon:yes gene_type:complete
MKCKTRWERDTLMKATLSSYVNGAYKKHRAAILFDMEKSRLPEAMGAVQNYLKVPELTQERKNLKKRYQELRSELLWVKERERLCGINLAHAKVGEALIQPGVKKAPAKVFKQACPAEGCRGFLSTAWKCGLCASWVCSKCFALKGLEKDDGHVCNPDDVKSADLIRSKTKNCPSCAVPIEKISGCDQMWCTQCRVAFSWRTGKRVNGIIHNPHFYHWQAQNGGGGGAAPAAPGAVICGGMPTPWELRQALRNHFREGDVSKKTWDIIAGKIQQLHRQTRHFTGWVLADLREKVNHVTDNRHLRIRFLAGEMDEKGFQSQLMRRDKQHEKNLAILQIYELMSTVFTESIRDIMATIEQTAYVNPQTVEHIEENLTRCENLRQYANKELKKISVLYNQTVILLRQNFQTYSHKFKRADLQVNA